MALTYTLLKASQEWRIVGFTMHAHTAKQEAIQANEQLPDDVPLDEIVYRLYVLDKVQRGLKDVDAGNTSSTEELAREIETW
jgi:hypothetical protein